MNTRKKIVKTVYRDDESEPEDFSESASEAEIPEDDSSGEESSGSNDSAEDFARTPNRSKRAKGGKSTVADRKQQFAKRFLSRLTQPEGVCAEEEGETEGAPVFSVKDLTEQDKLLPAVLNLSESDSSDDEEPIKKASQNASNLGASTSAVPHRASDSEEEAQAGYTDVWSKNAENSEEVAKKSFEQLQQHTAMFQKTKATLEKYRAKKPRGEATVKDLLALGEETLEKKDVTEKMEGSGSEMEDFEEVKDSRTIPSSGIQLVVDFPDAAARKSKTIDIEMMMRRKINRVKKEYQVYMHKVHVLCWLGHGNYVNGTLNDQDVLAAALSLLPSDKCYPSERVDMTYLIEISQWYRNKMKLHPDKNENKFKPKAPPLKELMLKQIKTKVVTSTKMLCLIFVSIMRALGIQCRVMMNFVTMPIRPLTSELCSLAAKYKMQPDNNQKDTSNKSEKPSKSKQTTSTKSSTKNTKLKISQLDGNYDNSSSLSSMDCSDLDDGILMQLDGNDDIDVEKPKRSTRAIRLSLKSNKAKRDPKIYENTVTEDNGEPESFNRVGEDFSPPKRQKQETAGLEKNRTGTEDEQKRNRTRNEKRNAKSKDTQESKAVPKRKSPTQEGKQNPRGKSQESKAKPTFGVNDEVKENKQSGDKTESFKADENLHSTIKETELKKSRNRIPKSVPKSTATESGDGQNEKADMKIRIPEKTINEKEPSKTNTSERQRTRRSAIETETSVKPVNKDVPQIKRKSGHVSSEFFEASAATTRSSKIIPKIQVNSKDVDKTLATNLLSLSRKRGRTSSPGSSKEAGPSKLKPDGNSVPKKPEKIRTRSAPGKTLETSKYFRDPPETKYRPSPSSRADKKKDDARRVSHRDLLSKSPQKTSNTDVKNDLVQLVKGRVRDAKTETKRNTVKGTVTKEGDSDSDYLPVEVKREGSSENDFKAPKKTIKSRKSLDRRVLSSDEESSKKLGVDVWCEVFVEEVEQWICIDIVKPEVHCVKNIYTKATHPVSYVVGWDNSNRLKDLTRRYVPHWNTVTRKQRAAAAWWAVAVQPWLGLSTHRDREEDEQLDKIMFDAPLPKSIAEYKNHPLYALKRHLLKFEALYPAEAPSLGFVRGEAVYARECVYTCRSRDTWLKEAKTVKPGEKPYKVVKARPKWDKLSNRVITDIPLEVFGPWQVQDYEPPTAEGGVVPRNAYGNVELFKECMLPKGTVHIKLPGLNKVAKKLNIDCAPAMTGFDFHGGWTHPVFDGFVVCSEFEQLINDAWVKDQEEMETREREKIDARVYGNWKRLIKGLFIRERLQRKYAFEDRDAAKKKAKGPRVLVKK